ncbi:hypothetical protein [Dyadobacter sp. CY345]|nr:hypothetical protein [Dyadobacter sp. CY345]
MYEETFRKQGKRSAEAVGSALICAIFIIAVYIAFCIFTHTI